MVLLDREAGEILVQAESWESNCNRKYTGYFGYSGMGTRLQKVSGQLTVYWILKSRERFRDLSIQNGYRTNDRSLNNPG